jgi:hypothetical protein
VPFEWACDHCGWPNEPDATRCSHCGRDRGDTVAPLADASELYEQPGLLGKLDLLARRAEERASRRAQARPSPETSAVSPDARHPTASPAADLYAARPVASAAGSPTATIADILTANPDGLSMVGLLAWARLRVAPDYTEAQLEAALAALGTAVTVDGGFVRSTERKA